MLQALSIKPPLSDLYKLIDKVPKFPVSNQQLVDFAAKARASKEVVDFYKTFSNSRVYRDREELAEVSEQVDMMRQEEAEMPREIERPEEN
jgi:ssDNA-specific exonuclease RecJ